MFVHTVFFWLKKDLAPAEVEAFEQGLKSLLEIRTIRQGHWGRPASTDRPVIDRTYDYGLTVVFDKKAEQDAYQVDPIHKKFVEVCAKYWIRVVVYDFE